MRERRAGRVSRFWVILGSLASVMAGLLLATMVLVVIVLLSPGGRDDSYCNADVAEPGPFATAPGQRVEYRQGTLGFPPKSTCSVYLVDDRRPESSPLRLLARTRYPGDGAYFLVLVCLLGPPALWAMLLAVSETSATRSRR